MGRTPTLASMRYALFTSERMARRVWTKYPNLLDGFADEAMELLDKPWSAATEPDRDLLARIMVLARNPNLALLLSNETFPGLREGLMDEAGDRADPLPPDASLLRALGVWILRRKDHRPGPRRLLELAKALRRSQQPELARRLLLHRLWPKGDYPAEFFLEVRDELALCTAMASDLPPGQRLDMADEVLGARWTGTTESRPSGPKSEDERHDVEARRARIVEIAAQGMRYRARISGRRWDFYRRGSDLESAARYFKKAARMAADPLDKLRSEVDAAYYLDLLAHRERELGATEEADRAARDADELRLAALARVIDPDRPEPPPEIGEDPVPHYRWLHNMAQLQLGLRGWEANLEKRAGELDETSAAELRRYQRLPNPIRHLVRARKIANEVPRWLQNRKVQEIFERAKLWGAEEAVQALLDKKDGDRAAIGRSISLGKVGLGLSGGGFRASLFHLGVLASLAEWDLLQQLEVVSCVSGGSIVGAQLYLELRLLLESKRDSEIGRDDYVELVRDLIHEFLGGVQKNIRTRVLASPWANLRMLFSHYTRSARAGDLLDRHLFRQVGDTAGEPVPEAWSRTARRLSDLRVEPKDSPDGFNPVRDNWRREHKVPILLMNATSLNTGHNWQFAATWMGESPTAVDPDVDSNNRLRRMDLGREAPPPHDRLRLGHAVAASACVPGLFEPSALPGLYQRKLVRLVDGGVFDNQGIAGLLEQECRIVLVSDASGQMTAQDRPHGGFLGSTMRTNTILMDRIRQTQYRDLRARRRTGQLDGLSYVHLKQGLEGAPVNWLGCDDPKPGAATTGLPAYGIPKPIQELLAGIRTDLDSFCDAEAYALMYSGYRMMSAECQRLAGGRAALMAEASGSDGETETRSDSAQVAIDWPFLCVEERLTDQSAPGHGRLAAILSVSGQGAFKIWRQWRRGRPLARWVAGVVALAPLAWLAWLYARWLIDIDPAGSLPVSALALGLLPATLAVLLLVPPLRSVLARLVRFALFGVVGMAASWIHLAIFDPLYLRYGREPAGYARRLLHEAGKLRSTAPAKAAAKASRALRILDRLLRPGGRGGPSGGDSPWLSRVAQARALALLGDRQAAAQRLAAVMHELEGAAREMDVAAKDPDRDPWLNERRETLRRRRAYLEQLAATPAFSPDPGGEPA